ncbi:MAG: transposase [Patescibacteria group bacterium]
MFRIKPVTDEIYHLYNRGVEKKNIFLDNKDRFRFIHDLFEFNDKNPSPNLAYHLTKKQPKEVGLPKIKREPRIMLVDILAFCLMPNHFHILIKQKIENGTTEFMRKLGTGYTNYFNKKYQRVGSLFQGKYKFVHLKENSHFIHIPYYIHLNPLDLKFPEWKNREIKNHKGAMKFLESYRWSSYLDYIGIKNFPSVTQREFLNNFFEGPEEYKKQTLNWLKEMDPEEIMDITLKNK